jgi:hypothetical protein
VSDSPLKGLGAEKKLTILARPGKKGLNELLISFHHRR